MFGGLGMGVPPPGGATAANTTTHPSTGTSQTSGTTTQPPPSSTAPTGSQPSAPGQQPSGPLGMDALSQAILQAYQQQGAGGETPSLGPQTTPMHPGGNEVCV